MSSKSVSNTVAKKLKYYLDVKRREDAFDLSGPYLPKEDPTPLRAGPTLAYDGIHDRSLKHYFRRNSVKKQLQHMTVPDNMSRQREKAIRRYVDETMATVDYRLKPGPISPYSFPQTFRPHPPSQIPQALRTVDQYFRTRKGSRRRKMPTHIVGKPRRIARRSPPEHIHNYERERLVNMASKLIVATETVALPQQKKQSKSFQTSEKELPRLERSTESSTESAFTSGHESEGSINGRTPIPPKHKPTSASQRRPQSSFFKSSSLDSPDRRAKSGVHIVLPGNSSNEQERLRYLMDRMNLDGRGTSVVASPHESDRYRPKSAGYPLKSTANTAVEADLPDYSGDDDFCSDEESSPRESARTPRMTWVEKESDMVDMGTQTVVHSGTQTKFPEFEEEREREFALPSRPHWTDKGRVDYVDARQPVAISTTGASTSDVLTSTASTSTTHETQTRNRDLEPKVITYEVCVQTGDRLGAGSKVNVKITIFGEYGNTGERQLLRSKTHRNKFQRGQVDVFAIDSLFLGKLQSIRIGHNETRLGYGWFLDKVYIKEGVEATRAFEFRCNRWFSSRDDDGQIMRDLPLYGAVPASHVEAILPKEQERKEEFYSASDSEKTRSENEESPREIEPRAKEKTSHKKPKQKTQNKTKLTEKQPVSKPLEEIDGFKGARAEDLFDVSEDEDQNEDRFFEPEEESESERSEDENVVDRKLEKEAQPVKRKPPKYPNLSSALKAKNNMKTKKETNDVNEKKNGDEEEKEKEEESEEEDEKDENEDENEKEEAEQSPKEEDSKPKKVPKGAQYLRVVTTAISPFLRSRQAAQPSPIAEEPTELPEDTRAKAEESEEDEPAVEFTAQSEKKTDERPSSAKSGEFEEGFRAGIRKKQAEERKRHRASVSESENILKSGSSIHDAAKNGNLDRIKELIQVVPAIKSTQDERGMTALHLAASNGHLDCVKWLAVSGVDLADETPTGYTAMHLSAMNGHVNCMMILAAMGSAISGKTVDSLTPLHLACMSGHIECVKWLLANRARMDIEDNNGRTPLDIAEDYGHEPIIKLLKKFKKELTRQDSTLAQLMTTEKRRKSMDSVASDNDVAPSKVSDSGVGGMESEEENWISDTEEDATVEVMNDDDTATTRKASTTSRPDSASRSRTDSIVTAEEKKKMFEQQRRKMKKRHSSFLDSIRMDVDNDEDF